MTKAGSFRLTCTSVLSYMLLRLKDSTAVTPAPLGIQGVNAEFLGKVAYWLLLLRREHCCRVDEDYFWWLYAFNDRPVSAAIGGLVALPFAIVAGLPKNFMINLVGCRPNTMAPQF